MRRRYSEDNVRIMCVGAASQVDTHTQQAVSVPIVTAHPALICRQTEEKRKRDKKNRDLGLLQQQRQRETSNETKERKAMSGREMEASPSKTLPMIDISQSTRSRTYILLPHSRFCRCSQMPGPKPMSLAAGLGQVPPHFGEFFSLGCLNVCTTIV